MKNMNNLELVLSNYELKYSDLSVFLDREERSYYVYPGVALIERVSINAEELGYKIFIGRLYNSGVSLSRLREKFHHDPRTIKKWGEALKSNDIGMIEQAFSGRKGNVKAGGEIIRYMRQQYKLRGLLGKRYREIIINGVEEIYGVKISKRLAGEIFKGVNIGREEEEFSYAGESEKWLKSAHTGGDVRGIRDRSVQRSPILMEEETGVFLIHHGGQILFERYMGYYYGLEPILFT